MSPDCNYGARQPYSESWNLMKFSKASLGIIFARLFFLMSSVVTGSRRDRLFVFMRFSNERNCNVLKSLSWIFAASL